MHVVLSWHCVASRGLKLVFHLHGWNILVHKELNRLLLMRGWDGFCVSWC